MNELDVIMGESNNENWNPPHLEVRIVKNLPQQTNGYDCGLYTCMFAKLLYMNEEMTFGGSFISSLRTFVHNHFQLREHEFITFQEGIWEHQHKSDDIPEYGE